jgi:Rieske Fe-S protein
MLRTADLYTYHERLMLVGPSGVVGQVINDYDIRAYTDVRNLGVTHGYIISLSQRIIIPAALAPTSASPSSGYVNYPALLINTIVPNVDTKDDIELIDYAPITVNAAVDTSINSAVSASTSDSRQYTTGSSTSVTNTYDVSVNLSKMSGVSGGFSHAQTNTVENSRTAGTDVGADRQGGSSDAMSVKEWGSYLAIDVIQQAPTWTWTQEYPWNVFLYQDRDAIQNVTLPPFVLNRLFLTPPTTDPPGSAATAAPPSSLSLTGLNFVSKARWRFVPQTADAISFTHTLSYTTASHTITTNGTSATLTPVSLTLSPAGPTTISTLAVYALDAVGRVSSAGALLSFAPSQFDAPPQAGASFSVKSAANDLLAEGTGFTFPLGADPVFQADVTTQSATLTVKFKIADTNQDYTLYLKHWKTTSTGCTLSITINEESPIARHVDAAESGGGSDNVLSIYLRNLDYTSPEFYDYLQMGLNVITITATSEDVTNKATCIYALRSLGIG